ncbi:MAG: hypothetical protein JO300_11650 [Silvibacterium sp.]|nr:hypothetical protein [Silvibacterium sp.]
MLEEIRTPGVNLLSRWMSIGAHSIVLAILIIAAHHAWQVRPVVGRGGELSAVLYWDDSVGTGSSRTHNVGNSTLSKTRRTKPAIPHEKQPAPDAQQASQAEADSAAGSSTSQLQNSGMGDGTQNATPAFPVYSPSPHLDRSLLPKSDENVVVEVDVSAMGEVLDEKLVHGLGNSVDQVILDTVKIWKFHPATVDGNAVASVAELVFPLGQKWRG